MWGNLGRLSNLAQLEELPNLRCLMIDNLYGFNGDQFPGPDNLPALTWISLRSIPSEAAKAIKALYKE